MARNTSGGRREELAVPGLDVVGSSRAERPVHLRLGYIGLVFAGGVLGALARYGVNHALPAPNGWPLPTLTVNLCGAFALGLLLEELVRRGSDRGGRRVLRLLLGTGFLGAFTTYSTLALDVNLLFRAGHLAGGVAYILAGLIGGLVAAWSGVLIGAAHHRRRTARTARAGTVPPQAAGEDAE
jgi:CrcB protein